MAKTNDTIDGLLAEISGYRDPVVRERRLDVRLKAAIARERGNAAKLREALMRIQNLAEIHIQDLAEALDPDDPNVIAILDTCRAALAAPPRNCDVGTAEEQRKRFGEFCQSHSWHEIDGEHCRASCPLYHGDKAPCDELEWAQLPYEEEGDK